MKYIKIVFLLLLVFPYPSIAKEFDINPIKNVFTHKDVDTFLALFDQETFTKKVINKFNGSEKNKDIIRTALGKALHKIPRSIFLGYTEGEFEFVSWKVHQGKKIAIIRTEDVDSGLIYLGITPSHRYENKFEDIYTFSAAEYMSTSLADVYKIMFGEMNSVLSKLKIRYGLEKDFVKTMQKMNQLRNAGRAREWLEAYADLPKSMAENKAIMIMYISMAGMVNDERYQQAMSETIAIHGDNPDMAFIFLDYHLLQENYDKAIEQFNVFNDHVGGDYEIETRIANVYAMKGDVQNALSTMKGVYEKYERNYSIDHMGIEIYFRLKMYDQAVAMIKETENRYDVEFEKDAFDVFPEAMKSPALLKWARE